MKVKIEINDTRLKKFEKNLRQAEKASVRVGIIGSEAADDHGGLTTGYIAAIHELGAGVERRSWLRDWVEPNRKKISEFLGQAMKAMSAGVTANRALGVLGAWAQGEIQKRISNGIPPALKPSTIAQKGSSTPLIDTGQLRTSITYEVEK